MRRHRAASIAALVAVLGVGGPPWIAGADPAPAPAPPPAPGTATAAAPGAVPGGGPKNTITADGTYAIGVDLVPGTYASAGPVDGDVCFWRRTSNPDGKTIDNALTKKPQIVQIDPADKAFTTRGCQPWEPTDQPPPPTGLGPMLAQLQLGGMLGDLGRRAAAMPPGAAAAPAPAAAAPAPGTPSP